MNTIDIHDGLIENLEWEARHAAKLDRIYESERNRCNNTSHCSNNTQQSTNDSSMNARLSMIENRLDKIESRIDSLNNIVTEQVESGGLFVFAPDQNVKAKLAFKLTNKQFNELIERIINK